MAKKRSRGLRPDEQELWNRVARTATPLHPPTSPKVMPTASKPQLKKPDPVPVSDFKVGQTAQTSFPTYAPPSEPPVRMDKKTFTKMTRGKSKPEARIDLHGMTAADAQAALTAFLFRAHGEGKRLVLVITGKGRDRDDGGPIPTRTGVLRQHLPHWVSTPPLNRIVLQVAQAHARHGGSGAFYLYLTRRR